MEDTTKYVSRVDLDFWPAWMEEHPLLFVQRVKEFLDEYGNGEWECTISRFAYLTRLTAIRKDNHAK